MFKKTALMIAMFLLSMPLPAAFGGGMEDHSGMKHDMNGHHMGSAPAGVMGAHTHQEGGWMFSYRYMYMNMDNNRDGTDNLDKGDVFKDYMVAPLQISMQMHMLGAMYAHSEDLSFMVMVPYTILEMDHETKSGIAFTTKTEGIGDIKIASAFRFFKKGSHSLIANSGLSLPTGSIEEKGDTPAGKDIQLPYPIQLGSGTYDFLPGITYLGNSGGLSWGSKVNATLRIGENDNDYKLGDRYGLTTWLGYTFMDMFGISARVDAQHWDNIYGSDPTISLSPAVPTADPDLRAGTRVDALCGIDISIPQGLSLSVEGGLPVYQHLDGPQLETDWLLNAALQWMF
jgi:hypothetical protein